MKVGRTNQLLIATILVLSIILALKFLLSLRPAGSFWTVEPIVPGTVSALQITTVDGTLRMTRDGEAWKITAPEQLPANRDRVATVLASWGQGFVPEERLTGAASDDELRDFGLDAEHRTSLTFELTDGGPLKFELGKQIRAGRQYIRPAGTREVFLGAVPAGDQITPQLEDWRDQHLFFMDPSTLSWIEISTARGRTELIRASDRSWTVSAPEGFQPTPQRTEAFVRSLCDLQNRRDVGKDEATARRDKSGLDTPSLELRFRTNDEATTTLRIGQPLDDENGVWAEVEGLQGPIILPLSAPQELDLTTDRSPTLQGP